jgi:hypothetical protein
MPRETFVVFDELPQCFLNLRPFYAIFSSILSFFLPATIMVVLYVRLYLYARKHARSMLLNCTRHSFSNNCNAHSSTLLLTRFLIRLHTDFPPNNRCFLPIRYSIPVETGHVTSDNAIGERKDSTSCSPSEILCIAFMLKML